MGRALGSGQQHTDHLFSLPRNFGGEVTLCYVGEKKKVPEMDRVISTSSI